MRRNAMTRHRAHTPVFDTRRIVLGAFARRSWAGCVGHEPPHDGVSIEFPATSNARKFRVQEVGDKSRLVARRMATQHELIRSAFGGRRRERWLRTDAGIPGKAFDARELHRKRPAHTAASSAKHVRSACLDTGDTGTVTSAAFACQYPAAAASFCRCRCRRWRSRACSR
jgi:hypothetical protein